MVVRWWLLLNALAAVCLWLLGYFLGMAWDGGNRLLGVFCSGVLCYLIWALLETARLVAKRAS